MSTYAAGYDHGREYAAHNVVILEKDILALRQARMPAAYIRGFRKALQNALRRKANASACCH